MQVSVTVQSISGTAEAGVHFQRLEKQDLIFEEKEIIKYIKVPMTGDQVTATFFAVELSNPRNVIREGVVGKHAHMDNSFYSFYKIYLAMTDCINTQQASVGWVLLRGIFFFTLLAYWYRPAYPDLFDFERKHTCKYFASLQSFQTRSFGVRIRWPAPVLRSHVGRRLADCNLQAVPKACK